jgi:translation initiation factor IF-3
MVKFENQWKVNKKRAAGNVDIRKAISIRQQDLLKSYQISLNKKRPICPVLQYAYFFI